MRNLVLILLAFLAVFTYIRAYEKVELAAPASSVPPISEVETSCVINNEITVEIIH